LSKRLAFQAFTVPGYTPLVKLSLSMHVTNFNIEANPTGQQFLQQALDELAAKTIATTHNA
jgi:hypothetical protein